MDNYVYMVRSAWYDEYHVFGIYTTAEAAREVLRKYLDERTMIGLHTYKWRDDNTVDEYARIDHITEDVYCNEYKIIKVPLNQWTEKPEAWRA